MNGSNGHSNGHSNGNSNGHHGNGISSSVNIWTIGLINLKSKRYITAETFGFKVNANGT